MKHSMRVATCAALLSICCFVATSGSVLPQKQISIHPGNSSSSSSSSSTRACTFLPDTDFDGHDIQPLTQRPAADAAACCALCDAAAACVGWTLQMAATCGSAGNCCYLKSSASGKRKYKGVTSGVSSSSPTPPSPPPPPQCSLASDCSLGGICDSSTRTCKCDPMFKGPQCEELNLLPASKSKVWNYDDKTASWGGNVVFDKTDGKWHLFFAEFLNHCGLGSWGSNSVVSHAVGDAPSGPFQKKEVVLPPFHHNPTIAYDASTETFLLISIGNGSMPGTPKPTNCNASSSSSSSSSAPAPNDQQSSPEEGSKTQASNLGDPAAAGNITLWSSPSANGPWTLLPRDNGILFEGRPGKWDAFVTNPSVHIFPNGTVLMAYRGGWNPWHVGVAIAPSWKEPFVRVSDDPIFPVINEDPGIFQDTRGNFHILTHYFGRDGPGGHAFSGDGINWKFAGQAYDFSTTYSDGSTVKWARRERPQVLSLNGTPAFLYTGVQPGNGPSHTFMQPINQV